MATRIRMRAGIRSLQLGRRHMSLTVQTINPAVVGAQYAVRGELVLRAAEIKKQIAAAPDSLPIKKVLECNIGNPQAVGQQPLSFGRQVQSLLAWPALMGMPGASEMFAPDAVARAQEYLAAETKVGAYTESQGLSIVRQQVAEFITSRDGVPAVKENVFLTDGASLPAWVTVAPNLDDGSAASAWGLAALMARGAPPHLGAPLRPLSTPNRHADRPSPALNAEGLQRSSRQVRASSSCSSWCCAARTMA